MSKNIHTLSVNIKRDFGKPINYIKTQNAERIYELIVSNFKKGSRSFNIVGAYGTGKSTFIVALEQSLRYNKGQFNSKNIFHDDNIEFINIVGENSSITDTFAELFGERRKEYNSSDIINRIDKYYKKSGRNELVIVIDEFGKFLEHAARHNPEKELFFIQQLAEFVNDTSRDILFITVLHKNFNAYSLNLTKTQIDEWNKVKGRLVELNFNEPVEQLLVLASKKIALLDFPVVRNKKLQVLHEIISGSNLFPFRDYNSINFSEKILPFDLLAASILTLSLQEYAQNERSLFSFIENDDNLGLKNFDRSANPFYNLACVYDYLLFHHYSFLSTKYNPHLNAWNAMRSAMERAEAIFQFNETDAIKIIKAIGLLNIFSNKGGVIDDKFLEGYSKYALGVTKPKPIIDKLIKNKIIHFTRYDSRYKILGGTDLDFELAINEAGRLIEKTKDVAIHLKRYFNFPVILAKRVSYEKGTPRFFSFVLSEYPVDISLNNNIDGIVNLIFNERLTEKEVAEKSNKSTKAILFGLFLNTDKIERNLYEIQKISKVIEINSDDKVAVNELKTILNHYKNLLNYYVIDTIYSESKSIKWFYKGKTISIKSQREFNSVLSDICDDIYSKTPNFKNELINRSKISGTISFARRNLFRRLLSETDKIDYGFDKIKYPPEKTIFLSLIKHTGIYSYEDGKALLKMPEEKSFKILWNESEDFFSENISVKKKVIDFIAFLKDEPFKLKQGFLDFWVPLFLIAHRNDFALFQKNKDIGEMVYIPDLNLSVLDLINKAPKDYYVRRFNLTRARLRVFNRYRSILNQIERNEFTNASFIETFRPFLIFYKSLPEFSTKTKRLSKKAINLRNAIIKSTDPEEVFFVNFPEALGFHLEELEKDDKLVENFAIQIKNVISEINRVFDDLINEIERYVNNEILGQELVFPDNMFALQTRYKKIKFELLKPDLRIFLNRVFSTIVDRKSWINSLVQSLMGKDLEKFNDEDINILKHKILYVFGELDNLNELSMGDVDLKKEEVIKLEITSFLKGLSKRRIHISKSKMKKINIFEKNLKKQLSENDKTFNIVLLTKLLQDELDDEKS